MMEAHEVEEWPKEMNVDFVVFFKSIGIISFSMYKNTTLSEKMTASVLFFDMLKSKFRLIKLPHH